MKAELNLRGWAVLPPWMPRGTPEQHGRHTESAPDIARGKSLLQCRNRAVAAPAIVTEKKSAIAATPLTKRTKPKLFQGVTGVPHAMWLTVFGPRRWFSDTTLGVAAS